MRMRVCINACVFICACMRARACVCVCVCEPVCERACVYMCVYVSLHEYSHAFLHICVCMQGCACTLALEPAHPELGEVRQLQPVLQPHQLQGLVRQAPPA